MRDGNIKSNSLNFANLCVSFRSDYEGWKPANKHKPIFPRFINVLEVTMRDGNEYHGGTVIFVGDNNVLEVTMRDGNPTGLKFYPTGEVIKF